MVTVKLTNDQARILYRILASDIKDYKAGVKSLKEIRRLDPERRFGKRQLTSDEAIKSTESAIRVLTKVRKQLKETKA